MNKEFMDALNQLAAERNLDKDQLLSSFEEALEQAFERNVMPGKQIEVVLDPDSGEMEVLVIRRVVEEIEDADKEILLSEAVTLDDGVEVGMEMEFPVDPDKFTRIAVQTTKQVITQKIREAERAIVFEEYKDRTGDVLTAVVSRSDNKRNVFMELGRGEAIMPPKEQIQGERYMVGMRLKVYVMKVELSNRGPSILVSRAAPELLEYLMRQEIPEVTDGTVEIKSVAREAGQRSKVAVTSTNPNVDPIGACIGHRGSRIQAVTSELQRERVDIILWDPNPREFIRNALSPAKVGSIDIDTDSNEAKVTVANDQLSLAIGKGGQNVRLAAKLTGFKIDLDASETVSDLDAALQAAASRLDDTTSSESKRAAFEALFSEETEGSPEESEEATS
ncbi:MAG: transcription termination/antitermination protein NusA [Trueperaceae bacterium]|nr:MAG: transcription termination/antitermination protein NusA [Trueperaceae bacterium]